MREAEMDQVAAWIAQALDRPGDVETLDGIRAEVEALCRRFPLYAGHWSD
jgi:glycine hydroxymethyltransferase